MAAAVAAAATVAAVAQPIPHCCCHPPPLRSPSMSATSFLFSSPAVLSAGCRSPVCNVLWLVVVCTCPLSSLSVSLAVGRWHSSLLLCCRQPAPLLLIVPPKPRWRGRRGLIVILVDTVPAPMATNAGAIRRGCCCHCPRRQRGPVGRREAIAEDALLVLKR